MQVSHSRLGTFESCKFKYKMHYVEGIKTIPPTNADNALILGTAIHTGIEKGLDAAIKEYMNAFPMIDDLHINEIIKLEYLIPKVRAMLPEGIHELQIRTSDFIAFMDLITPNEDGSFDLYDFKYSNNIENYMESGQLHEYKYFYEKQTGKKIRKMFFVFIPKVQIKQKKTEDLRQFRNRIKEELEKSEITIKEVKFDLEKVIDFTLGIKKMLEETKFEKNPSYLCNWCDYQEYCEKGWDYMLLPKNERRNVSKIEKKVIWLYGSPFSGKTYLANQFPDPLMLNTDGNIKFIDSPYVPIKDIVTVEGRITKKQFAWAIFKDVIAELEKKQNDFKTIVVDLLEDTYEHCRLYMYDQMGISHESDDSFRAWDKVRGEFLNTLKRLMNLDYENIILISHEDTSKDITKKGGDKITSIKPNMQEKAANKVAGMVDMVARVVADDNIRTLNFKTNEVIFGGGRLSVTVHQIPLDYEALMKVYDEANLGIKKAPDASSASTEGTQKAGRSSKGRKEQAAEEKAPEVKSEVKSEAPNEAAAPEEQIETPPAPAEEKTEAPAPTRKSRGSKTEDPVPTVDAKPEEIETETQSQPEAPQTPEVRTRKKRG